MITPKIKKLIEGHSIALATITKNNKPNVIGVAFVKVVSTDQILITDNFMNQTIKDIAINNNVCLAVWDKDLKGCKLIGKAKYHTSGKWREFVEQMTENKGLPAKGAVLVKISKIINSL